MTSRCSTTVASIVAVGAKAYVKLELRTPLLILLLTSALVLTGTMIVHSQSPATYYVDCIDGKDINLGTSTAQAWKSMAKANSAPLQPGDQLLFKRGCAWKGPLKAAWNGTAAQPIVIGAYATGSLPKIQDAYSGNVQVSGTYQIIEYIETTLTTPPNPDQNCDNQPVAWKVGFGFSNTSAHNIVQHSKVSKLAIGVYLGNESHHNKVLNNTITDNNVAWELYSTHSMGAVGVMLKGDHHEIAHNYFANNRLICTYTDEIGGISIELYGARNANVHHNQSFNDRFFAELGSSAGDIASDNVFAYNLHVVDSQVGANFLITRGQGSTYGPVWRTRVYNNTLYLTGQKSKGIVCGYCGSDVLTVKNNILWVDTEPISSDGPFVEENNIFWSTTGTPLLNFARSLSSLVEDPAFLNVGVSDFHLKSTSPALNAGNYESVSAGFTYDLDQVVVPQSDVVDIGAYELFDNASPTPVPSPTPDPIAACSITINDGALYTGVRSVQIRANVPNATQMIVSNDAGFTGATWEPYQTQFDWMLRDTNDRIATLLVYARFSDTGGTTLCGASQISDDIIYDPIPPTLSIAIASVASVSTEVSGETEQDNVSLWITANDQENGSGVERMQVSLDEAFSDQIWQLFAPSTSVNAVPGQMIYVRVQDGSGNVSQTVSVMVPDNDDVSSTIYIPLIQR